MPTGAMKVALCFSLASMKIVKTSSAVKNASMKTPCATLVPPARVVLTLNLAGKSPITIPEAAIAPAICATKTQIALKMGSAPTSTLPSVTAGLNRPPEIRKNIHTFTIREKPKASEM